MRLFKLKKFESLFDLLFGVVLILIGIEVANYFGTYKLPIKAFGLVGFILLAYGGYKIFINIFVHLIALSVFVISRINNQKAMSKAATIKMLKKLEKAFMGVFIFSLLWLLFEIKDIDNTLRGIRLFQYSLLIGFLTGITILTLIFKFINFRRNYYSLNLFFIIPLAFSLLAVPFTSVLNKSFISEKRNKSFIIFDKGSSRSSSSAYFLFIQNGEYEERLDVDKYKQDQYSEGDSIHLELEKGLLGYEVIKNL
jgi:hypothetical protein